MHKAVGVALMKLSFDFCLNNAQVETSSPSPRRSTPSSASPGYSWQNTHSCTQWPYLALAESTLCAMLDPGRPSEANHIHLIQASFGDVVADGVGLARIRDTTWAALVLWKDTKFTLYLWARQGPAVNFSLLWGREAKGMYQREERQKRKDRRVIFILRSSKPTYLQRTYRSPTGCWHLFCNGCLNSIWGLNKNDIKTKATSISPKQMWTALGQGIVEEISIVSDPQIVLIFPSNLFINLWKTLSIDQKMRYKQNLTMSLLNYTFFSVRNLNVPPPTKQHKMRQNKIWFPSLISRRKLWIGP